jgi:predicted transcriptional regulator
MAKPKGRKVVVLSIRTDEAVRDGLQQLADMEDRSISYYADRLFRQHLAEKGIEIAEVRSFRHGGKRTAGESTEGNEGEGE